MQKNSKLIIDNDTHYVIQYRKNTHIIFFRCIKEKDSWNIKLDNGSDIIYILDLAPKIVFQEYFNYIEQFINVYKPTSFNIICIDDIDKLKKYIKLKNYIWSASVIHGRYRSLMYTKNLNFLN